MFQNAETILQATANDNELHRLQVKLIEGPIHNLQQVKMRRLFHRM